MNMPKEKITNYPIDFSKHAINSDILNFESIRNHNIINKKCSKKNKFFVFCYDSETKKFKINQVSYRNKNERKPGGGLGLKPKISRSASCLVIPNAFYNQNRMRRHEKKVDSHSKGYRRYKRSLNQTSSSESNFSLARDSIDSYKENLPNLLSSCRRKRKWSCERDYNQDQNLCRICAKCIRNRYNDEDDGCHDHDRGRGRSRDHDHDRRRRQHNSHRSGCGSHNPRGNSSMKHSRNEYNDDRPHKSRRSSCKWCSSLSSTEPQFERNNYESSSRNCHHKRYHIKSKVSCLCGGGGGGTRIKYNLRRPTSGCSSIPEEDQLSSENFKVSKKRNRSKTVNFHDECRRHISNGDHELVQDDIPYKFQTINPRYSLQSFCSGNSFEKSKNNLYLDVCDCKRIPSGVAIAPPQLALKYSNSSTSHSTHCSCRHRKRASIKSLRHKISNMFSKRKSSKHKKPTFHPTDYNRYNDSLRHKENSNHPSSMCFNKFRRSISCIIKKSDITQSNDSKYLKNEAREMQATSRNSSGGAYPTNYRFQRRKNRYRDSEYSSTPFYESKRNWHHAKANRSRSSSDDSYKSSNMSIREDAGHLNYDDQSSVDIGYEQERKPKNIELSTVKPSNIRFRLEKDENSLNKSHHNVPQEKRQNNFSLNNIHQSRNFSCPAESSSCFCCNIHQGKILEDLKQELLDQLMESRSNAANVNGNCSYRLPCNNFEPTNCLDNNNFSYLNQNWALAQPQPLTIPLPQPQQQSQMQLQPNSSCPQVQLTPFYNN